MATKGSLKIDLNAVEALADRVGMLTAERLNIVTKDALKQAADNIYELAADGITVGLNLSDSYVRRKMVIDYGKGDTNSVSIIASAARSELSRLARYDAQMTIVPRTTNTPSRAKGRLPVPVAGDMKQRGATVSVTRGTVKGISDAFMLPLNRGNADGDKFGVFRREGRKVKHLFGPSVYQLFGHQIRTRETEFSDALQAAFDKRITTELERVFPK